MAYSGPGKYVHYKGGSYVALGLALNASNEVEGGPEEFFVVYTDLSEPGRALSVGCPMYIRSLKEFDQEVPTDNLVDCPRGRLPRFRRVG